MHYTIIKIHMFTGIIVTTGKIIKADLLKTKNILTIENNSKIFDDFQKGYSISVDGICLTLEEKNDTNFTFKIMDETIKLTNLKFATEGKVVNLEPAMKASDRFNGHVVQGHIDCTGAVSSVTKSENQHVFAIRYPKDFSKYLALKGSITVNGISLTISNLTQDIFEVCIVEHTFNSTNLCELKKDDIVNLEFDAISKYIEKLLDKKEEETKYQYLLERGFV